MGGQWRRFVSFIPPNLERRKLIFLKVSLAWTQRNVSSPIVGFNSLKRVDQNLLPEGELTDEEAKYLEEP